MTTTTCSACVATPTPARSRRPSASWPASVHPDVNPDDPECEAQFKEAAEAYEVAQRRRLARRLRPLRLRRAQGPPHDRLRARRLQRPVQHLLRRRHVRLGAARRRRHVGRGRRRRAGAARRRRRGRASSSTFAEAVFGVSKDVEVRAEIACATCAGSGATAGHRARAVPAVPRQRAHARGLQPRAASGSSSARAPATCAAARAASSRNRARRAAARAGCAQTRTVTVDVPAGIADGQRLRLTGEGGAGAQGGRPGDLYVSIAVEPHEDFVRDGDDLIYRLDITMVEAALGTTAYVPALDGDIEVRAASRARSPERSRRIATAACRSCRATAVATSRSSSTCWCRASSPPSSASCSSSSRSRRRADYEPDQSFLDKVRAVFRQ